MPPRKRTPSKPPSNVVPIRGTGEDAVAANPGKATNDKPTKTGRRMNATGRATNARAVKVAERRADAINLRRMNLSFQKIADTLGPRYNMPKYSRADAYHDVQYGLDAIVEEPARELLAEELSRLAVADAALMPLVSQQNIPAILAMIRVMDHRAKLRGLYSPIKHDLSGVNMGEANVANLQDPVELAAAGRAAMEDMVTAKRQQRTGTTGTTRE